MRQWYDERINNNLIMVNIQYVKYEVCLSGCDRSQCTETNYIKITLPYMFGRSNNLFRTDEYISPK